MGAYSKRDEVIFDFPSVNLDSTDFYGSSPPSVFVGRYNYPKVNVGVLSPIGKNSNSNELNDPKSWILNNYKPEDIVKIRSNLINSRFKSNVKTFDHRLITKAQEISLAYKPVDVEISLNKKPFKTGEVSNITSPILNSAQARNIKIIENPKVKTVVEKTVADNDLKAADAVVKMYNKEISENFLSQILSIGMVGVKRKLVPTRWSITATDDIIGKNILNEIQDYNEIEHSLYFGGHLGNYYLVLFFPGVWSYELFEVDLQNEVNMWSKSGKKYSYDYEDFFGRKNYAEETAGGYYAARLPVLEKLRELKRKGSVLVIRLIDEDYNIPLGVWVCREAARISMKNKVKCDFNNKESIVNYIKSFVKNKFNYDLSEIIKESKILNGNKQVSLKMFSNF